MKYDLQGFIEFCESKGEATYVFADPDNCAHAQFCRALGMSYKGELYTTDIEQASFAAEIINDGNGPWDRLRTFQGAAVVASKILEENRRYA